MHAAKPGAVRACGKAPAAAGRTGRGDPRAAGPGAGASAVTVCLLLCLRAVSARRSLSVWAASSSCSSCQRDRALLWAQAGLGPSPTEITCALSKHPI